MQKSYSKVICDCGKDELYLEYVYFIVGKARNSAAAAAAAVSRHFFSRGNIFYQCSTMHFKRTNLTKNIVFRTGSR